MNQLTGNEPNKRKVNEVEAELTKTTNKVWTGLPENDIAKLSACSKQGNRDKSPGI